MILRMPKIANYEQNMKNIYPEILRNCGSAKAVCGIPTGIWCTVWFNGGRANTINVRDNIEDRIDSGINSSSRISTQTKRFISTQIKNQI